jgi:hypothetical protein
MENTGKDKLVSGIGILICAFVLGQAHDSFAGAPSGSPTPVAVAARWAPSHTTFVTDAKQPEPKFEGLPTSQFDAQLRESRASYRIELKTVEGKHLKTITGSATNGFIQQDWNLTSDRGVKLEDHSFDAFFYVTYSGDKQTNAPARDRFNKIGR